MAIRKFKLEDFSSLELDEKTRELYFEGKKVEFSQVIKFGFLGKFFAAFIAALSLLSPFFYYWAEKERIAQNVCGSDSIIVELLLKSYLVACEITI